VRVAQCRCGALRAECEGEPVRVSVCHCQACKRRTGSAFSAQARWPAAQVRVTGASTTFRRTADSGGVARYRFCPQCGATIAFETDNLPGLTAVPLGAFADPEFAMPQFSIYESRKYPWVAIVGDGIEHDD
jgi:hypothetical protein